MHHAMLKRVLSDAFDVLRELVRIVGLELEVYCCAKQARLAGLRSPAMYTTAFGAELECTTFPFCTIYIVGRNVYMITHPEPEKTTNAFPSFAGLETRIGG